MFVFPPGAPLARGGSLSGGLALRWDYGMESMFWKESQEGPTRQETLFGSCSAFQNKGKLHGILDELQRMNVFGFF